jgi:hypothetical protein
MSLLLSAGNARGGWVLRSALRVRTSTMPVTGGQATEEGTIWASRRTVQLVRISPGGLSRAQRRHAVPRSDRNEPIAAGMGKAR